MTDLVLSAVVLAETIMIGAGVAIAFKVARLTEHAPLGWVLLTFSFGVAFVRAVIFLYVYLFLSTTENFLTFIGQLLGVPLVVFILAGVYNLYRDFEQKLRERQAALLAPQEQPEQ